MEVDLFNAHFYSFLFRFHFFCTGFTPLASPHSSYLSCVSITLFLHALYPTFFQRIHAFHATTFTYTNTYASMCVCVCEQELCVIYVCVSVCGRRENTVEHVQHSTALENYCNDFSFYIEKLLSKNCHTSDDALLLR